MFFRGRQERQDQRRQEVRQEREEAQEEILSMSTEDLLRKSAREYVLASEEPFAPGATEKLTRANYLATLALFKALTEQAPEAPQPESAG